MKHEKGQNYSIAPALFSPDSKRVYCYGHRRTLWDIETQKMLADFGAYNGAIHPFSVPTARFCSSRAMFMAMPSGTRKPGKSSTASATTARLGC